MGSFNVVGVDKCFSFGLYEMWRIGLLKMVLFGNVLYGVFCICIGNSKWFEIRRIYVRNLNIKWLLVIIIDKV